jgi:hypothetical protein
MSKAKKGSDHVTGSMYQYAPSNDRLKKGILTGRVADPHSFDTDPDLDPAF